LRDVLQIAATGRGRDDLAWIGEARGVEGISQSDLGPKVVVGEEQWHEVTLFESDAVLARQDSPGSHTGADDFLAGRVHPVEDTWLSSIEDEKRVQIAITGVENVQNKEIVSSGDLVHLIQDGR
jgi:hypothetical protein